MTVNNNYLKAKIVVNGIVSYQRRIPATVTNTFVVNEIISGLSSTAFAKVAVQANIGDDYIVVKQMTRYFSFNESLVGSIDGLGESIGTMITGDEPYENTKYGIENGVWSLETTGDLLSKIDDSIMKININTGGALASGYSFGFTIANFGLIDEIDRDGVYMKNTPVNYFIDFGSGYIQVWAGLVDTFPKVGDTTAEFKCTDISNGNIKNIGSDTIPIALNRNYNCKLVPTDDEDQATEYINRIYNGVSYVDTSVWKLDTTTNSITVYTFVDQDSEYKDNYESNFDNGFITIMSGNGAGSAFKIYKVKRVLSGDGISASYECFVNSSVDSLLSYDTANGGVNTTPQTVTDVSICRIVSYANKQILSTSAVNLIHTKELQRTEKPFTGTKDGFNYILTNPDNYTDSISTENYQVITTKSIDPSSNINIFSDIPIGALPITILDWDNSGTVGVDIDEVTFELTIPQSALETTNFVIDAGADLYLDIGEITLYNGSILPDQSLFTYNSGTHKAVGNVNTNIVPYATSTLIPSTASNNIITSTDGYNLLFDYSDSIRININSYLLNNYNKSNPITGITIQFTCHYYFEGNASKRPSGGIATNIGFKYGGGITQDNLSIGCNGENVEGDNQFETYPNTIKYIQKNYMGISDVDIDTESYDQAEEDFDLYPSITTRNPAHQITEQTDVNTLLKDMLKSSDLGMYYNRLGQYSIDNWLPKSTVFSDSETVADYTAQDWLPNGIGKIDRSQITEVISDFQLDYNYNEATDEYEDTMRIKNTSYDVFDFDTCTEGISTEFYAVAEQAWVQYHAGFLRTKKETQTIQKSMWIKKAFTKDKYGNGESEAINYIRNHSGLVNRELEKVTIILPLNETDAIINLLSFISVTDEKRTEGETRNGWIISHILSWINKKLTFNILLDISSYDPFIEQINIIQDDPSETDEIINDPTSDDIIQDGTGN